MQGKPDVLQRAACVLATNHRDVAVAKESLPAFAGSGGSLVLSFALPDRLDGPEQLALGAGLLEQRLRSTYAQGVGVVAWALTGQGFPTAERRDELKRLEAEYLRLLRLRASVGIRAGDVPGPTSFSTALAAQMEALLDGISGMHDPFSRQSSAGSDNRAVTNDRINRYSAMLKKLVDGWDLFRDLLPPPYLDPKSPSVLAFNTRATNEVMARARACYDGGMQALKEDRFATVAAELLRLEVAEGSKLMEVKQLPLGNVVKSKRADLELEVRKHIDALPSRCRACRRSFKISMAISSGSFSD